MEQYIPETEHVIRLAVAVLLGGAVGLERELRDKPAGFRTIILICVGACVFTIISQVVGGPDMNHTRIAAQVVTGIGFLGAGAILRDRKSVFGLTTAATIWSVAAIGMAVGFGHIPLGVLGTVAILLALFGFDVIENRIGDRWDIQEFHIATLNSQSAPEQIKAMFSSAALEVRKLNFFEDGDLLVFHVVAMGAKERHEKMRIDLVRSDDFTLRRSP